MNARRTSALALLLLLAMTHTDATDAQNPAGSTERRPRARDIGLVVGVLRPGPLNAITDVAGVRVGHATLIRGESVRTGVTAVVPHEGNLFQEKVPAAVFVGNGFGKLMGTTQVEELGELETPILLTNTLSVGRAADALVEWMLGLPGNEEVRSVNAVVGETNDGQLNDIRGRHVGRDDVFAALRAARAGEVEEGAVGAGTGTVAFGFKGGIGTSSRVVPATLGGYTVGVLVQTNYGGVLTMNGAPVGRELGKFYLRDRLGAGAKGREENADGSVMIVVATDAPLDARNLKRLAARALLGLARTGSPMTNGSGDYVIAFSTARQNRVRASETLRRVEVLGNDAASPLFLACVEATEEAVYNSLLRATTVTGHRGARVEALPLGRTIEILKKYNALAGSN
ncbi:MAG TPA: P1 family peptidase [Pyrinomonadaceae bacterium]|nr:P1 family peptidase [Pyrinomonadaceae bacterium]